MSAKLLLSFHPALIATTAIALAIASAALAGCGSSAPRHKSTSAGTQAASSTQASSAPSSTEGEPESPPPTNVADPNSPTVVRIGKTKLTKADIVHWMRVVSPYKKHEVPLPPNYVACIIRLHKSEAIDLGGEGRAANTLKSVCAAHYKTLLQTAVSALVADAWLIKEAARDGISLDQAALEQEAHESEAQFAEQPGGFAGYLAETGRTAADFKFELKAGQLSGKIYQLAEHQTPGVTGARVASYYAEHKHDFAVPETRDLYILHTKSLASALEAKRKIASGQSFASVVAGLHGVAQPIGAKEGVTLGLSRKSYSEPVLIDPIFNARPGVLSGPVQIKLPPAYEANGFYVFQVKRKIPAHQMPSAEAASIIKKRLPDELHKQTLAAFVAAYKARWRAQTDCSVGWVVEGCRQHPASKVSKSSDPFVL
jgi:foldase protein PrsA